METRNNYREAMDSALEKLQRLIEMRQQAGLHKVEPRHVLQLRGDFEGMEYRAFEEEEAILNEYPDQDMDPAHRDEWLWTLRGVVDDLRRAQTIAEESMMGAEKSVRILTRTIQAHIPDLTETETKALDYLSDPLSLRCIGGNILLNEAAGIKEGSEV